MPHAARLPLAIAHSAADAPTEAIASEKIVVGAPAQRIANAYSSADGTFHCGIWEGDIGAWRVRYTEDECCHMLAGRVRIVADSGEERIVAAGDSFVLPAGFTGVWEVLEPARKLYAVYEPTG